MNVFLVTAAFTHTRLSSFALLLSISVTCLCRQIDDHFILIIVECFHFSFVIGQHLYVFDSVLEFVNGSAVILKCCMHEVHGDVSGQLPSTRLTALFCTLLPS